MTRMIQVDIIGSGAPAPGEQQRHSSFLRWGGRWCHIGRLLTKKASRD